MVNWKDLTYEEKRKIARERLEDKLGNELGREIIVDGIDMLAAHYMTALESNCHYGFEEQAKIALDFLVPYCEKKGDIKMLERARTIYDRAFKSE